MMHHESRDARCDDSAGEPLRRPRLPSDFERATALVLEYHPNLSEIEIAPLRIRILEHIDFLRSAFPDISEVSGKRILDIACGSRNYPDNRNFKYEPWMCRLLLNLGATPVGIDLSPQTGERFESHQVDLIQPGALQFLESRSFDAYYICAFPTYKAAAVMRTSGPRWPIVRDEILSHLTRCLKPEGKVIRSFTSNDERLIEAEHRDSCSSSSPTAPSPQQLDPRVGRYFEDCSLDD